MAWCADGKWVMFRAYEVVFPMALGLLTQMMLENWQTFLLGNPKRVSSGFDRMGLMRKQ
jgi:hypothetical protein